MSKIKAIIKRPDEKYGHMTSISNSLKNLQRTVDGYIELVSFTHEKGEVYIICNEDGKIKDLEKNMKIPGDVLVGTIIICGSDDESGECGDVPISFAEWKTVVDQWESSC